MLFEYREYPSELKKKLLRFCREDFFDLDLYLQIQNIEEDFKEIVQLYPLLIQVRRHRTGMNLQTIQLQNDLLVEKLDKHDSSDVLYQKTMTYIALKKTDQLNKFWLDRSVCKGVDFSLIQASDLHFYYSLAFWYKNQ